METTSVTYVQKISEKCLINNPDYGLKCPLWNNIQLHLIDVVDGQELRHYGDSYKEFSNKEPNKQNEEYKEMKHSETNLKSNVRIWKNSELGISFYLFQFLLISIDQSKLNDKDSYIFSRLDSTYGRMRAKTYKRVLISQI